MEIRNASAIVTGGASGIGRSLALALVQEEASVHITDIQSEKLAQVLSELNAKRHANSASVVDHTLEEANREFSKSYLAERGAPDILCLNVGVGLGASIEQMTIDDWRWIIDRNLWANIFMAQLFIPAMIAASATSKRSRHVLITSSVAGFAPAPAMSAYCLTKYALLGFAESLRLELYRHDIGVSALCPGLVNTNIINAGRMKSNAAPAAGNDSSSIKSNIAEFYAKRGISPDRIAKDAMMAIRKNIAIMPTAEDAKAMYWARKLASGAVDFTLSRLWKWGIMKGISG